MRTVAWVGAALLLAGLIVLAVAGISGATAVLVTAVALTAMIGIGSTMGGRHTPDVEPVASGPHRGGGSGDGPESGDRPVSEDGPDGGTADGGARGPAGELADGGEGGTTGR